LPIKNEKTRSVKGDRAVAPLDYLQTDKKDKIDCTAQRTIGMLRTSWANNQACLGAGKEKVGKIITSHIYHAALMPQRRGCQTTVFTRRKVKTLQNRRNGPQKVKGMGWVICLGEGAGVPEKEKWSGVGGKNRHAIDYHGDWPGSPHITVGALANVRLSKEDQA